MSAKIDERGLLTAWLRDEMRGAQKMSARYQHGSKDRELWSAKAEKFREAADALTDAPVEGDIRQIIFDALDLSEELRIECTADVVNALSKAGVALTVSKERIEVKRDVAWLIERKFPVDSLGATEPRWYAENHDDGWHWWAAAEHAKRFTSKAEVEAFPAYQMISSDPTIRITEHVFIGSAALAHPLPAVAEPGVTDEMVAKARRIIANGIRPVNVHGKVAVAIPDSVVRHALEAGRSSLSGEGAG